VTWNDKLSVFDGLKYKPVECDILSGGLFELKFAQAVKD
jgi:hypothetical protein